MDIESFYELIDLLDLKFAKKTRLVVAEEGGEEIAEEATDDEAELENEEAEEEVVEENGLDKYDIFKHPNIFYTPHGGGKAFEHGKTDLSIGSVQMIDIDPIWIPYRKFDETFDLVPDEEAYYFNEKGESENEEKQYS